jgi:hypothetical protein
LTGVFNTPAVYWHGFFSTLGSGLGSTLGALPGAFL